VAVGMGLAGGALRRHIEKMPRTERIVISLYYHEELTLRQIAKVVKSA